MSGADGSVLIDTKLDGSGLEKGLKELEGKAGSTLGKLGSTVAKGAAVAVAAVSAGLVAAGKYVVQTGMEFESAFAGVIKTVDATDAELADLRQGIIDMSREMPITAVEIAGVAEAAGQLGISNSNILSFTEAMTNLGVATNMSANEAATSLARFANIMGNTAKDTDPKYYERLGSAIVALGNNYATTESEIVELGLRLAGAGQQIGISEAEVLALSASMSSLGINAEAGGSAMSRTLSSMNSAVIGNGSELKKYAKVAGVSAKEFAAAWSEDPLDAFMLFTRGLDGIAKSGGDVDKTLKSLGLNDIRITDMLKRMAGNEEMLAGALELSNGEWIKHNALTKEAEQRYATLESQVAIFGNNLKALAIQVYDSVRDELAGIVKFGNDMLSELYDGFKEGGLDGLLSAVGSVMGQVVTAVVEAAPKVAKAATSVMKALVKEISKSAGKIGNAAADIGTELITGLMEIIPGLLDTAILLVVNFAEGLASNVGPLVAAGIKMIAELALSLIRAAPRIVQAIPAIIRNLIEGFQGVDWAGLWNELVTSFQDAWTMLKSAGMELWDQLKSIDWAGIWEGIQTAATQAWDAIKNAFTSAWEAIKGIDWGQVWESVKAALANLGSLVKYLFTGDAEADWSDVASAAWSGVQTALGLLGSLVKVLITGNSDAKWEDVAQVAWDGVKSALSALGSLLKRLITGSGETSWSDVASKVWGGVKAALGALGSLLKQLITGDGNATWNDTAQAIWGGVQSALSSLGSLLKQLITGDGNATWTDTAQTIWGGVQAAFGTLGSLFKELITGNGNASWGDVAQTIWDGVKTAFATLGHSILDLLGISSLSSKDTKEIIGSFKLPETFKMQELADAKTNVSGLITEISNLQTQLNTATLKLQMGVEFDGTDISSFSEAVEGIINGGLAVVEAQKYNVNVTLGTVFADDSLASSELSAFFNAAFSKVEIDMSEAGGKIRSALADAIADGNLTAEEAAKIALMAQQFEAEVNKTLGDIKLKAKLRRAELETPDGLLDTGALHKIVGDTYKMVHDAFELAGAGKEEEIVRTYQMAEVLELDKDTTKKYVDYIEKGFNDQLAKINLEGLNSIFDSVGPHLNIDSLLGQFGKLGGDLSDFIGSSEFVDPDELNHAFDAFFQNPQVFSDLEGLTPEITDRVKALVSALEPAKADLLEVKENYTKAGLEVPQGIVDALERVEVLEAIKGGNESMFAYLRSNVIEEMVATGATYEEAMQAVMGRVGEVLATDLALPNAMQTAWDGVFNTSLAAFKEWQPLLQQQLEELGITAGQLLGVALPEGVKAGLENGKVIIRDATGEIVDLASLASQQAELNAQSLAAGEEGTGNVATGVKNEESTVSSATEGVKDTTVESLAPLPEEMAEVTDEAMGAMTESIDGAAGDVGGAAGSTAEAAVSAASGVLNESSGHSVGQSFGQGIASGISASTPAIAAAASSAAQAAYSAAMAALDAHSPSRLMRYVGEYVFGGGFALGIEDATQDVATEAAHLSEAAADALESRLMLDVDFDAAALVRRAQAALDREQLTLTAVMDASTGGGALGGVGTTTVMIGPIEIYTEHIDDEADMDYLARSIAEEAAIQARYKGVS